MGELKPDWTVMKMHTKANESAGLGAFRSGVFLWTACLAANILASLYSFSFNAQIIAEMSVSAPIARDAIYAGFKIPPLIIIAFIIPLVLSPRVAKALSIASGILAVSACAMAFVAHALPAQGTIFIAIAFAMLCIGGTWYNVMPILMLCRLKSFGSIALCAFAAQGLSGMGSSVVRVLGSEVQIALLGIIPLALLALAWRTTKDYADLNVESGHVHELELRNMRSFVPASSPAFICLFVFHCVSGFALALNCVSGVPVYSIIPSVLALTLPCLAFLRARDYSSVDAISGMAAFCIIGGLLSAIVFIGQAPLMVSNIALTTGSHLLSVLETLILVSMGRRSPVGTLRVIALGKAFSTAGTLIGSMSGHFVNSVTPSNPLAASLSLALILLMFLVLCYLWLRRYTFEKLIFSVEPTLPVDLPSAAPDELQRKCDVVVEKYGLTEREAEICAMLASGMGGKEIERKCVISYNTVKTHVKHIYAKLGIHSQQELIDLIETLQE